MRKGKLPFQSMASSVSASSSFIQGLQVVIHMVSTKGVFPSARDLAATLLPAESCKVTAGRSCAAAPQSAASARNKESDKRFILSGFQGSFLSQRNNTAVVYIIIPISGRGLQDLLIAKFPLNKHQHAHVVNIISGRDIHVVRE